MAVDTLLRLITPRALPTRYADDNIPRCKTCQHFRKTDNRSSNIDTSRWGDTERQAFGECTLLPVWVDTWESRYCGQHKEKGG